MHTDCHFAIGRTHLVCQDYALVGIGDNKPLVVLSDGCSSSPHTDLGARALCFAAVRDLPYIGSSGEIAWVAQLGSGLLLNPAHPTDNPGRFRLDRPNYLDATLLMAYPREDSIEALAAGDGVICARSRRDKSVETRVISFSGNAPGYPSYTLHSERLLDYCEYHGQRTVKLYGDRELLDTETVKLGPESLDYRVSFPQEDYDLVVLFSDGVESFHKEVAPGRFEPVPLFDVLDQLMAIKGFTGQFVVRRMRRFLSKFCLKNKWHHNDDVSMGAIHIPDETTNEGAQS